MRARAATTRVSTKGQVVLPLPIRRRLGIQAGDALDATVEDGRIMLTPQPKKKFKARLTTDKRTGLPVLSFGPGAPILTNEMVREMLADFP
jgi:AbrB family looped-hinge helix DNA binding protein